MDFPQSFIHNKLKQNSIPYLVYTYLQYII